MALEFSAGEVFEMACQIERNGAAFYRSAAETVRDAARKQKLLDLATMEDEHLAKFTAMLNDLSAKERIESVYDPDNVAAQYLRALADTRVFNVSEDPRETLTGNESLENILLTAIGLEKDSIIFYLGICELVPEKLGNAQMDDIIREEMGHIVLLSDDLAVELEK